MTRSSFFFTSASTKVHFLSKFLLDCLSFSLLPIEPISEFGQWKRLLKNGCVIYCDWKILFRIHKRLDTLKFIQKLLKLQKNQRMIQITTKSNFECNYVTREALQLFFCLSSFHAPKFAFTVCVCVFLCVCVCVCITWRREFRKALSWQNWNFPPCQRCHSYSLFCHSV